MINREDMLELTRRMTPTRTCFDRIAGAYISDMGEIEDTFNICKCQYKNVGFIQNNYVEKPTFLFCIFSLLSSVKCCI